MSYFVNRMSDVSLPPKSPSDLFSILPDMPLKSNYCSPAISEQIDLMLTALEALTVGGIDQMMNISQQLELDKLIRNRIFLWRLRCTNPLRRSYRRNQLTQLEAKALVLIIHHFAQSLQLEIRQRLIDAQLMQDKKLPVDTHFQLSEYLEKFKNYFKRRMNPRRVKVNNYLTSETDLNEIALSLLTKLLFCTGSRGSERLWVTLFDGEIKQS